MRLRTSRISASSDMHGVHHFEGCVNDDSLCAYRHLYPHQCRSMETFKCMRMLSLALMAVKQRMLIIRQTSLCSTKISLPGRSKLRWTMTWKRTRRYAVQMVILTMLASVLSSSVDPDHAASMSQSSIDLSSVLIPDGVRRGVISRKICNARQNLIRPMQASMVRARHHGVSHQ